MLILICYDVATGDAAGERRLRRIAEACKDYGMRVQYSVFECKVEARDWVVLKARLLDEYNAEKDSLRFYFLCSEDAPRTEHHGTRRALDVEGPLIL